MERKVGIIGAGPAGIMAAKSASMNPENKVLLMEKNDKIGKKLFITGKGRCNITNASYIDDFFEMIPTNKEFMYSSLYTYTNYDIVNLLEELGVETKVERGNRVFPKSNKSSDVIFAFERLLKEKNINLSLNTEVSNIKIEKNKFIVNTNRGELVFDSLIIATGGISYPNTGSTGDGYRFAKKFGHTIKKLKPSLIPMNISNHWINKVQGLSLKNVELKLYSNEKLVEKEFGEMLFTHFGVSGPIVLSMSSKMHKYKSNNLYLEIDFKPALDEKKLDKRLLRDFEKYNNKQIKNGLGDLLPEKIIPIIIDESNIKEDTVIHQITKNEREKLLQTIKGLRLNFDGFRPIRNAIITSGGIKTDEINSSTMESKIIPNLFFAGEIIDVDALTGGYNLQIAYSTGYLAGLSI